MNRKQRAPKTARYYRVITVSFLHEGKTYKHGDLIDRDPDRPILDYSIPSHLVEIYEPPAERSPYRLPILSRLLGF